MAWWVHRFPVGATAIYKVTKAAPMTPGEDIRSPDNDFGYLTIPIAEAALSNMGLEDGTTWYIHRTNSHSSPAKWYTLDHNSSNAGFSKTCPGAPPGYPTIKQLADAGMLNTMHSTNVCGVIAMLAASYARSARAGSAKKKAKSRRKK